MLDSSDDWLVPGTDVGDTLGVPDEAVVAIPKTEDLGGVGVESAQEDGEVIGLSTRIHEEDTVKSRTQSLTEHL